MVMTVLEVDVLEMTVLSSKEMVAAGGSMGRNDASWPGITM